MTAAGHAARDAAAAVRGCLEAIERADASLGAFVEVAATAAEKDAEARQSEATAGRRHGPLHDVPVAVKELFDVAGADGSYGSLVLAGRRASADAAIVAALRRAGAVVVGTTRSHEFGWGITTQHASRGSTRNPWDLDRIPGGSSGGSAAAVAAGLVPLAVASDTGGSIRIPASFCGVYGLKTTPGRISRTGGVPLAPSFDTPGFLSRDPSLLADALAAAAGLDAADPATLEAPALAPAGGTPAWGMLRVAVADPPAGASPSADRLQALTTVADALVELGGRRFDVSLPDGRSLYDAFVPHQMAEAFHVHHRVLGLFPDHAGEYGADVRARLEAAASVTAVDYVEARRQAAVARAGFLRAFTQVDLILSLVGAAGPSTVTDPDQVQLGDRIVPLRDALMPFTVPQNLAGLPSVTVPVAQDDDGMPIGVQLTGRPWSEPLLVAVAAGLDRCGASRSLLPPLHAVEG